jgi:hypothetical protein
MKHSVIAFCVGASILCVAPAASAQWGYPQAPSSGACFYEDINYGGRYFCARIGSVIPQMPGGANNDISSIRIFGNAEVTVFRDGGLRGSSRRFSSNIRDLRGVGWNDRISSYRVDPRSSWGGNGGGAYGGGNYGGGYGGGYNGGYGGGAYGGGSYGGEWGHSGGSRWTYQQAQEIVRRAYRSVLGRDPDPAASGWVNEVMKNNWSQQQLEAQLRNSQEYREKNRR